MKKIPNTREKNRGYILNRARTGDKTQSESANETAIFTIESKTKKTLLTLQCYVQYRIGKQEIVKWITCTNKQNKTKQTNKPRSLSVGSSTIRVGKRERESV